MDLLAIDHIGVRVTEGARSVEFYERLGFVVAARHDAQRVIILRHPSGIEINLIVNAVSSGRGNVLLDEPIKYPGYTHVALRVRDVQRACAQARTLGLEITEGPVELGDGTSFFVRDPDGNVIELRAPTSSGP